MSDVRDALIVAGGRGTRLQPLTFGVPKPLVRFCGTPFLAGVMARLAEAGVQRVFLVVGQETAPFDVLQPFADELGLELEAVPEPTPLDTAGGVRAVSDRLDGPFFVLNGDILTDIDLAAVAAAHVASGADATITLTRVEDTSAFGVCVREGTRITDFVEKPAPGTLPGQDSINAGTYILNPDVLAAYPQGRLSFERQVFPELLGRGGHIEGFVWEGVWADLGTPDRFREGTALALAGALQWPSVSGVADRGDGVRVAADASVAEDAVLNSPVLIHSGATVGSGAVVSGSVVGAGATIEAGAEVSDSILGSGTRVGAGVSVHRLLSGDEAVIASGAIIGAGVVLGNGAMIAADAVLADDARVPEPS